AEQGDCRRGSRRVRYRAAATRSSVPQDGQRRHHAPSGLCQRAKLSQIFSRRCRKHPRLARRQARAGDQLVQLQNISCWRLFWRSDRAFSIPKMAMNSIALCYPSPCYGSFGARRLEPAEDTLKDQKSARAATEIPTQNESPDISLGARLSAYRKESGQRRPDFARAYDELVERLNVIDRGEVGPQLGQLMPRFDLPDENGQLISLPS